MAKILVIDDDAMVRTTIEQTLEDAGYEVVTARNGLHGTAAFHRTQPDLVITDIVMPEQDGIQTITKNHGGARLVVVGRPRPGIRRRRVTVASERNPRIHHLLTEAFGGGRIGNADFLKNALALGAMDVVPKPFDPDALLTVVANCLAGRSHPR